VKHTIRHDLPLDLALRTARAAVEHYRTRYARFEPKVRWIDEHKATIAFVAKRVPVEVCVDIRPGAIDIDIEVPFLLRIFRQRAIDRVEADFAGWLTRARAGEF
jgi:hypothetical protein